MGLVVGGRDEGLCGETAMTVALMNTVIAAIDYAPPPSLTSIFTAAQLTLWPTLPADQLIPAVQTAPYTLNTVNFVIREYQLALGGVPDVGGAAYWTHALSDGAQTDEFDVVHVRKLYRVL